MTIKVKPTSSERSDFSSLSGKMKVATKDDSIEHRLEKLEVEIKNLYAWATKQTEVQNKIIEALQLYFKARSSN